MDRCALGDSGITVSKLCYGTLTLGPAQAALPPEEGGALIAYGASRGITFLDTAEYYETYDTVRAALRLLSQPPVICTKTYAWNRTGAEKSVEKARREMDVDVIDIFLLHEQETVFTLAGHQEAFRYLLECRDRGIIRAVGVSTHAVQPVRALTQARRGVTDGLWADRDPGPYREATVVHPLLNVDGLGLLDGTASDMTDAVAGARSAGIGVLGMKMLGGGNLLSRFDEAVAFALNESGADAYAVGMQTKDEIDMNVALFEGRPVSPELLDRTRARRKRLLIDSWCTGCGACVQRCGENALRIENGRAQVDASRCLLCGYCAYACPDFAIKVV